MLYAVAFFSSGIRKTYRMRFLVFMPSLINTVSGRRRINTAQKNDITLDACYEAVDVFISPIFTLN